MGIMPNLPFTNPFTYIRSIRTIPPHIVVPQPINPKYRILDLQFFRF